MRKDQLKIETAITNLIMSNAETVDYELAALESKIILAGVELRYIKSRINRIQDERKRMARAIKASKTQIEKLRDIEE